MKKLLFLIALIYSVSAKAQTSVYHPFPDSNAVWNTESYNDCILGSNDDNYSITMTGDTIINAKTYHKLFTPFIQSYIYGSCSPNGITGYKGAIRQDTAAKKVFCVLPYESTEQLLYDFNMQVGDTVKGVLETYPCPVDTVHAIDSIIIGNSYRKRWLINSCYGIYIIEGIGSTAGLLMASPGCITDANLQGIICFQENDITLYPDTASNCQLITSINSVEKNSNKIKAFPNPSNGSFTVAFDQPLNILEIRISDLLGKNVLQKQTENQSNIKINNLNFGTYIITIFDKDYKATNIKVVSCP